MAVAHKNVANEEWNDSYVSVICGEIIEDRYGEVWNYI